MFFPKYMFILLYMWVQSNINKKKKVLSCDLVVLYSTYMKLKEKLIVRINDSLELSALHNCF